MFDNERTKQAAEIADATGTLLIDGWSQLNRALASTSFSTGTALHFIDSFDFDENGQSAEVYLRDVESAYDYITKAKGNVIALATDNCNTMISMRNQFAISHPEILTYACSDHLVDLILNDFVENTMCGAIVSKVKSIQNVFRKHSRIMAGLKSIKDSLQPLVPNETRWHYSIDMLANYEKNHSSLVACFFLPQLKDPFRKYQSQMRLLLDAEFNEKVHAVSELLEPFKTAIKQLESDLCAPESVVKIWCDLRDHIDAQPSSNWRHSSKEIELEKFDERCSYALSNGHLAAFYLSPNHEPTLLSTANLAKARNYARKFIDEDFLVAWQTKDLTCLGVASPSDFVEKK